jgi:hypothetical protein
MSKKAVFQHGRSEKGKAPHVSCGAYFLNAHFNSLVCYPDHLIDHQETCRR